MPLKISLKPHEKIYMGGAVLQNGGTASELSVLNEATILREKDILTDESANSPCRRIYLTIQLMYMEQKNLAPFHETYWSQVREIVDAAPSFTELLRQISEEILDENFYKALKLTKKLIDRESEVLKHATFCSEGV
jgi:flagellar protein FlbT